MNPHQKKFVSQTEAVFSFLNDRGIQIPFEQELSEKEDREMAFKKKAYRDKRARHHPSERQGRIPCPRFPGRRYRFSAGRGSRAARARRQSQRRPSTLTAPGSSAPWSSPYRGLCFQNGPGVSIWWTMAY